MIALLEWSLIRECLYDLGKRFSPIFCESDGPSRGVIITFYGERLSALQLLYRKP